MKQDEGYYVHPPGSDNGFERWLEMRRKGCIHDNPVLKQIRRRDGSPLPAEEDEPEEVNEPEDDDDEEYEDDTDEGRDWTDELCNILKNRQRYTAALTERKEEDYCKEAAELARRGMYASAINLCEEGLEYFPNSGAILSDVIHHNITRGTLEGAKYFYEELTGRIPRRRFRSRNYDAAAAYLLTSAAEHEEELRDLLAAWRRALPHDELSRFWESRLEEALGHCEQSIQVLEGAVDTLPNAAHCALRLAKEQLAQGLYAAAVHTADYGLCAAEAQKSCMKVPRGSEFFYVRTRAKDALLHQTAAAGGAVCRKDAELLLREYRLLRGTAAMRGSHERLADRVLCLELMLLRLPEEMP